MTDRLRVTVVFEYDLPDGKARQDAYDTMDPGECAVIDAANLKDDIFLGLSMEDLINITVEPVKEGNEE